MVVPGRARCHSDPGGMGSVCSTASTMLLLAVLLVSIFADHHRPMSTAMAMDDSGRFDNAGDVSAAFYGVPGVTIDDPSSCSVDEDRANSLIRDDAPPGAAQAGGFDSRELDDALAEAIPNVSRAEVGPSTGSSGVSPVDLTDLEAAGADVGTRSNASDASASPPFTRPSPLLTLAGNEIGHGSSAALSSSSKSIAEEELEDVAASAEAAIDYVAFSRPRPTVESPVNCTTLFYSNNITFFVAAGTLAVFNESCTIAEGWGRFVTIFAGVGAWIEFSGASLVLSGVSIVGERPQFTPRNVTVVVRNRTLIRVHPLRFDAQHTESYAASVVCTGRSEGGGLRTEDSTIGIAIVEASSAFASHRRRGLDDGTLLDPFQRPHFVAAASVVLKAHDSSDRSAHCGHVRVLVAGRGSRATAYNGMYTNANTGGEKLSRTAAAGIAIHPETNGVIASATLAVANGGVLNASSVVAVAVAGVVCSSMRDAGNPTSLIVHGPLRLLASRASLHYRGVTTTPGAEPIYAIAVLGVAVLTDCDFTSHGPLVMSAHATSIDVAAKVTFEVVRSIAIAGIAMIPTSEARTLLNGSKLVSHLDGSTVSIDLLGHRENIGVVGAVAVGGVAGDGSGRMDINGMVNLAMTNSSLLLTANGEVTVAGVAVLGVASTRRVSIVAAQDLQTFIGHSTNVTVSCTARRGSVAGVTVGGITVPDESGAVTVGGRMHAEATNDSAVSMTLVGTTAEVRHVSMIGLAASNLAQVRVHGSVSFVTAGSAVTVLCIAEDNVKGFGILGLVVRDQATVASGGVLAVFVERSAVRFTSQVVSFTIAVVGTAATRARVQLDNGTRMWVAHSTIAAVHSPGMRSIALAGIALSSDSTALVNDSVRVDMAHSSLLAVSEAGLLTHAAYALCGATVSDESKLFMNGTVAFRALRSNVNATFVVNSTTPGITRTLNDVAVLGIATTGTVNVYGGGALTVRALWTAINVVGLMSSVPGASTTLLSIAVGGGAVALNSLLEVDGRNSSSTFDVQFENSTVTVLCSSTFVRAVAVVGAAGYSIATVKTGGNLSLVARHVFINSTSVASSVARAIAVVGSVGMQVGGVEVQSGMLLHAAEGSRIVCTTRADVVTAIAINGHSSHSTASLRVHDGDVRIRMLGTSITTHVKATTNEAHSVAGVSLYSNTVTAINGKLHVSVRDSTLNVTTNLGEFDRALSIAGLSGMNAIIAMSGLWLSMESSFVVLTVSAPFGAYSVSVVGVCTSENRLTVARFVEEDRPSATFSVQHSEFQLAVASNGRIRGFALAGSAAATRATQQFLEGFTVDVGRSMLNVLCVANTLTSSFSVAGVSAHDGSIVEVLRDMNVSVRSLYVYTYSSGRAVAAQREVSVDSSAVAGFAMASGSRLIVTGSVDIDVAQSRLNSTIYGHHGTRAVAMGGLSAALRSLIDVKGSVSVSVRNSRIVVDGGVSVGASQALALAGSVTANDRSNVSMATRSASDALNCSVHRSEVLYESKCATGGECDVIAVGMMAGLSAVHASIITVTGSGGMHVTSVRSNVTAVLTARFVLSAAAVGVAVLNSSTIASGLSTPSNGNGHQVGGFFLSAMNSTLDLDVRPTHSTSSVFCVTLIGVTVVGVSSVFSLHGSLSVEASNSNLTGRVDSGVFMHALGLAGIATSGATTTVFLAAGSVAINADHVTVTGTLRSDTLGVVGIAITAGAALRALADVNISATSLRILGTREQHNAPSITIVDGGATLGVMVSQNNGRPTGMTVRDIRVSAVHVDIDASWQADTRSEFGHLVVLGLATAGSRAFVLLTGSYSAVVVATRVVVAVAAPSAKLCVNGMTSTSGANITILGAVDVFSIQATVSISTYADRDSFVSVHGATATGTSSTITAASFQLVRSRDDVSIQALGASLNALLAVETVAAVDGGAIIVVHGNVQRIAVARTMVVLVPPAGVQPPLSAGVLNIVNGSSRYDVIDATNDQRWGAKWGSSEAASAFQQLIEQRAAALGAPSPPLAACRVTLTASLTMSLSRSRWTQSASRSGSGASPSMSHTWSFQNTKSIDNTVSASSSRGTVSHSQSPPTASRSPSSTFFSWTPPLTLSQHRNSTTVSRSRGTVSRSRATESATIHNVPAAPARVVVATPSIQTTSSVAAVAASASGSPAAAVFASRLSVMGGLAYCDDPDLQPIDRTANPLGLEIGDGQLRRQAGALVGGVALLAAVVALHRGGCLARELTSRGKPANAGVPADRLRALSLAWGRFPSLSVLPMVLLGPSVFEAGIAIVAFHDDVMLRALGIAYTVAYIAFCAWTARLLLMAGHFQSVFDMSADKDAEDEEEDGGQGNSMSTCRRILSKIAMPVGHWRDKKGASVRFTQRHVMLYADYEGRARWFMLVEMGVSTTVACVGAAMAGPNSGCESLSTVAATILVGHTVAVFAVHPHESLLAVGINGFLSASQAASGIVVAVATRTEDEQEQLALEDIALWLSYATLAATLVLTGYDLWRVGLYFTRKLLRRGMGHVALFGGALEDTDPAAANLLVDGGDDGVAAALLLVPEADATEPINNGPLPSEKSGALADDDGGTLPHRNSRPLPDSTSRNGHTALDMEQHSGSVVPAVAAGKRAHGASGGAGQQRTTPNGPAHAATAALGARGHAPRSAPASTQQRGRTGRQPVAQQKGPPSRSTILADAATLVPSETETAAIMRAARSRQERDEAAGVCDHGRRGPAPPPPPAGGASRRPASSSRAAKRRELRRETRLRFFRSMVAHRGEPLLDSDDEPIIEDGVVYDESLPASIVPPQHWKVIPRVHPRRANPVTGDDSAAPDPQESTAAGDTAADQDATLLAGGEPTWRDIVRPYQTGPNAGPGAFRARQWALL